MRPGAGQSDSAARRPVLLYTGAGLFLVVMAFVVVSSLVRREPPSFVPDPVLVDTRAGEDRAAGLVVDTATIDARDGSRWVYFDFAVGETFQDPIAGWDLAISRYHVAVNGGRLYAGAGGAIALEDPWESVLEAPLDGYTTTEDELGVGVSTPAFERWYSYGFLSHLLEPKGETYVVRTAEGRYAKVRVLSYYCPGATPGCLTIEYAFQSDGSRRLGPISVPAESTPGQ